MFEGIINFFKKFSKNEEESKSKDTAKERLHLVLMQDRANVSADFLEMMKQEIIEVIKKYIEVDEKEIDVKLTNKTNEDGSVGAPALYANIPISKIKNENKLINESDENKKIKEEKIIKENKKSNENDKENTNDTLNENESENGNDKTNNKTEINDNKNNENDNENNKNIENKEIEDSQTKKKVTSKNKKSKK